MPAGGEAVALYVVTGSPGCGKSTWVRATAQPGDIRFDSDAMTNLLTGKAPAKHHHDNTAKKISRAAREAGIAEAVKHRNEVDVYILMSNLNREDEQRFRRLGARFIIIDPGFDVAMQRCKAHRPGYKQRLVISWYDRRSEWPADAEIICPEIQTNPETPEPEAGEQLPATAGGATIRVVTGPPAAGKSTFVRQQRQSGDVTIDFDTLANELAGVEPSNHEHPKHIKAITKRARQAAIDTAIKQAGDHTVWIIHSSPSEKLLEHYRSLGARIDVIDPGKDIVMKRVKAERPGTLMPVAAAWYAKHKASEPSRPKTTTERGYGWQHQQDRQRLIRRHRDGTPCWWCGLPMFGDHTKTQNWDRKALAADHSTEAARSGGRADRLLHGKCNSQRQDGSNDHLRPVLTGRHPSEPLSSASAPSEPAPVTSGFDFGGVSFA